jgi:hypothetical protein
LLRAGSEKVFKIILGTLVFILAGLPSIGIVIGMLRGELAWKTGVPAEAFLIGFGAIAFRILFSSSTSVIKKAETQNLEGGEYYAVALRYCRFKTNQNRWHAVFFIVFGLFALIGAIVVGLSLSLGFMNYIGGSVFSTLGFILYFNARLERIDLEANSSSESPDRLQHLANFLSRYNGDRVGARIQKYLESKNTGCDNV